jgi:hypothetical protein
MPDFPVRECFRHEHAHATRDDLVTGNGTVGFNHVCLKGRMIQQASPNAKRCSAPHDLVTQARGLNVEAFKKIGFRDRPPVHGPTNHRICQDIRQRA